jgi:hypothetical protein
LVCCASLCGTSSLRKKSLLLLRIEAVLRDKGELKIDYGPEAYVTFSHAGGVCGMFRIYKENLSNRRPYVISWWISTASTFRSLVLHATFAPDCNPYHKRKATDVCYGEEQLLNTLRQRLRSMEEGTATEEDESSARKQPRNVDGLA